MNETTHDRQGFNADAGPGYAYARDLWAMSADGDEWGTLMGSYFGVATVLYLRTGEMVPKFRPGPILEMIRGDMAAGHDVELDFPDSDLWDQLDAIDDDATRAEWLYGYRAWAAWCDVESDLLKAEGKDY